MLYLKIKSPKPWDGVVKTVEPFSVLWLSSCGCHALGFQKPCTLVEFGGLQLSGKKRQQSRSPPRRCPAFGDLFCFIRYQNYSASLAVFEDSVWENSLYYLTLFLWQGLWQQANFIMHFIIHQKTHKIQSSWPWFVCWFCFMWTFWVSFQNQIFLVIRS